jgi:hypothetical protein
MVAAGGYNYLVQLIVAACGGSCWLEGLVFLVGSPVQKQVNDKAVSLQLVILGSKVQLFKTHITEKTGGGGVERRLPVIFGQGPQLIPWGRLTTYCLWRLCCRKHTCCCLFLLILL